MQQELEKLFCSIPQASSTKSSKGTGAGNKMLQILLEPDYFPLGNMMMIIMNYILIFLYNSKRSSVETVYKFYYRYLVIILQNDHKIITVKCCHPVRVAVVVISFQ